jgi:hypothetical protein
MKRKIILSIIILLLSNALIMAVYANATNVEDKETADKTDNGKTLTQTLTLYKNGTMVAGPIESLSNDSKVFGGIEIPQSWRNVSAEKREPTEEDWTFLRNSMKDLSEEEKDKLLKEFKEISEGKSKLSEEEQTKVCLRIGYYITEATEGNVTKPKWVESPELLETLRSEKPIMGAIYVLQYITSGPSYMWKLPRTRVSGG